MPIKLYSEKMADQVCEYISQGMGLREISEIQGMPARQTVHRWLQDYEDFRDKYARAREAQADHFAEEIIAISDDGQNDWMARNDPENGGYQQNGEVVARSRLRVDARKWVASKLAPKKYGDRIAHDVTIDDMEDRIRRGRERADQD